MKYKKSLFSYVFATFIMLLVLPFYFSSATTKENNQAATQLYDIWIATYILDQEIQEENRPRMELNLSTMEVMGNNGCNHYQGKIAKVDKESINFGNIASTNKMCHNMELSDAFDRAMNSVESYSIAELELTLYNKEGEVVLVFQKGD